MADEQHPSLGESVGELRSDSKRNFDAVNALAVEMRRMSDKFESISTLSTELTQYRLTLHDRFDRINEIAASTTLTIDKMEDRLAVVENSKLVARQAGHVDRNDVEDATEDDRSHRLGDPDGGRVVYRHLWQGCFESSVWRLIRATGRRHRVVIHVSCVSFDRGRNTRSLPSRRWRWR